MTFNPGLNRVTIADFAGLPGGMAGSMAHEWLATWSIAPRMRARFSPDELAGLSDPAQGIQAWSGYPVVLEGYLERGIPGAAAFAEEMGIALAAVIATLKLAPPESRAARPEWPDAHWARWQQVNHIVLGGGVLSGTLGQYLFSTAQKWLPRLGAADVRLHLFPHPRQLMLYGAARQYQEGQVVALDAGHTAIKRASAELSGGVVTDLRPAPMLPTPYDIKAGDQLLGFLVEALVDTVPAGQSIGQFTLSLSVHLDENGNVAAVSAASSFYGALAALALEDVLRERLERRLGSPCEVRVMHEGQAAVHGLPGMDAAILLGTSVGGAFKSGQK